MFRTRKGKKKEKRRKTEWGNPVTKIKYNNVKQQDDKIKQMDNFQKDTIKVNENSNDRGNCQIATVAHQLSGFVLFRSDEQLKMDAINHIKNWLANYGEFVAEPLDTYAEKMKFP